MKKGKYEQSKSKKFPIVWLLIAFLLIVVFLIFVLRGCDTDSFNGANDVLPSESITQNPDSIAIPGYEMLQLTADAKKQILSLPNPAQNMCYFQITLYLEDGTLLWQSELIEPGTISKPIVLEKALEKGSYPNSILHYSCFTMDDERTPLNGAETKLTLWVQ